MSQATVHGRMKQDRFLITFANFLLRNTKMKLDKVLYSLFLLLPGLADPRFCSAYEVATHAAISQDAAKLSKLKDSLQVLGINLEDTFAVEDISEREINRGTPIGWIMEGSIREDDTVSESFFRYRNHFFDPLP